MKEIASVNGVKIIVDDDMYSSLSKKQWRVKFRKNGKVSSVYSCGAPYAPIQYDVLGINKKQRHGYVIDHINHNPLDNRRENLRICTQQENMYNRALKNNDTGYFGVCKQPGKNHKRPYFVRIRVNGKLEYFGHYATPGEAARVYDEVVKELRGEFAVLNFKYD